LPESGLTDEALRDRIREVKRDEESISYERRLLHGKIDVVRSEIIARMKRGSGDAPEGADSLEGLVQRLTDALTHTGPPPLDDELARFGHADDPAGDDASVGDVLPELSSLGDAELAGLVKALTARERRTSARRQELHRELDRLRSDHVARLQQKYSDTVEG
jgi:hypothetical protein